MDPDKSTLIKSDVIRTGDDTYLLVLFYYHVEYNFLNGVNHTIKDKSFYKCVVRHDTLGAWNNLADLIAEDNPAEMFRLSDIGINDNMMLKGKRFFTRHMFSKWLKMKFKGHKPHTLDQFLHGHRQTTKRYCRKYTKGAFDTKLPYVKEYTYNDIKYTLERPLEFPLGVWIEGLYIFPPRKKPRIIKD